MADSRYPDGFAPEGTVPYGKTRTRPKTLGEQLAEQEGYDAEATQTLKNVEGVLTWVTDV